MCYNYNVRKVMSMYLECETWLGETFICKVSFIKGILILLFCDNKTLIKVKKLSKKDLIFD